MTIRRESSRSCGEDGKGAWPMSAIPDWPRPGKRARVVRSEPRLRGCWEEIMKTHCTALLAMLVGVGIGGIAVRGLHAQSKPMVYLITEIDVTDPEKYGTEFAPKA